MATSPWLDMAFLIERQLFAQQQVLSGERGAWAQAEQEVPHTIDQECQQGARERHEVVDQALESCHSCGAPLSLAWSSPTIVSTRRLAVQSCFTSAPRRQAVCESTRLRRGEYCEDRFFADDGYCAI